MQPPPPPQPYAYLGRMRSPAGVPMVLLGNGEQTVVATAGLALDNGYIIERIGPDAVYLQHAAPNAPRQLPLPPPTETEGPPHGS